MQVPHVHHYANVAPRDTIVIAGQTVALTYEDPAREYAALRDGVAVVKRSERGRWTFSGDKATTTLTGLVTNDVEALTPGGGCYAAALTAKGRIIADVRVLRREADLLVDVPVRAAAGWREMVRKYVNPRVTLYADVTGATGCIGVYGPKAAVTLARLSALDPNALASMPSYHHVEAGVAGRTALVVRSPDLGVSGFDLVVDVADAEPLFTAIAAEGARPTGLAAADILRVEAGRPEWGIDMDETTIPQEANLDALHAISYTKGCYTGQEVVARVHFRGHVNRLLRGLSGAHAIPPRATLASPGREDAGDVRSSVVSPRFGPIALAMVRREIEPGDDVTLRANDHEHTARVVALPF